MLLPSRYYSNDFDDKCLPQIYLYHEAQTLMPIDESRDGPQSLNWILDWHRGFNYSEERRAV